MEANTRSMGGCKEVIYVKWVRVSCWWCNTLHPRWFRRLPFQFSHCCETPFSSWHLQRHQGLWHWKHDTNCPYWSSCRCPCLVVSNNFRFEAIALFWNQQQYLGRVGGIVSWPWLSRKQLYASQPRQIISWSSIMASGSSHAAEVSTGSTVVKRRQSNAAWRGNYIALPVALLR